MMPPAKFRLMHFDMTLKKTTTHIHPVDAIVVQYLQLKNPSYEWPFIGPKAI